MKNIIQSLCRHITTSESVVTVVHGFPQSTYGRVVGELGVGVLADHGRAGQGWRERASVHQSWL